MNSKNNTVSDIWSALSKSKRVLMSLHAAPDGDSLGSCAAVKYLLERDIGASVTLISEDELDSALSRVPAAKEVLFGKSLHDYDWQQFDTVIFLDNGRIDRYDERAKQLVNHDNIINIDHHASNTRFGNLNYVIDDAPAACAVLLDIFKQCNVKFDAELSKRLLLGICTDSGFFRNRMNLSRCLHDAVFLLDHGADYLEDIVEPVLNGQPLKMKKYLGFMLNNLVLDKQRKVAYSTLDNKHVVELNLNKSEIRLGIKDLQDIEGADCIFTLVELDNGIKGSFRTTKRIDVSKFATALGGGGHKPAAGFYLEKMPLDKAVDKVLQTIDEVGMQDF